MQKVEKAYEWYKMLEVRRASEVWFSERIRKLQTQVCLIFTLSVTWATLWT